MVTMDAVKNGVVRFLETDVIPQMGELKKLAFSAYVVLAADGLTAKLMNARDNMLISATGIIQDNGTIDIDRLYTTLCDKLCEDITINIPMLGRLTLGRRDLDRCYHMIIGSE